MERREVKLNGYVYLIDDNLYSAWIKKGRIGRRKKYRVPSKVAINGVEYTIDGIDYGAYRRNKTIRHLIIPDTITHLDEDAFRPMPNLRSVYIGKGVRILQMWNLGSCGKLQSLTISTENPHLQVHDGLVLSKDGKMLYTSLFDRRHYDIPDGVETVNQIAFWYNQRLESLSFPDSLRTIGDNSFSFLPRLRKIVLPEGLEKVSTQCFQMCEHLEYVYIPSTLKQLDTHAFYGCKSLKRVIIRSDVIFRMFFCKIIVFSTEVSVYAPDNLLKQHQPIEEYYENLFPISKLTNDNFHYDDI